MNTTKLNKQLVRSAGHAGAVMALVRGTACAVLLAAGALSVPQPARADITYTIDISGQYLNGAGGDLTGTITTNGIIGILDATDIVSYDLSFEGSVYQGTTDDVDETTNEFALATDDIGGVQTLFWQDGDDQGDIGFVQDTDPVNALWFIGDTEISQFFGDEAIPYERLCTSCTSKIGVAAVESTPVPEPATIALLGLGLVALAAVRSISRPRAMESY